MNVTLKKILESGALGHSEVVSGTEYLTNSVEYIDVLESPSGYQWLQPNIIVLSTLYPILHDEEAQSRLFENLNSVGVSALAIKPHRFIESIPDFLIQDSERYHIPIIQLPPDASYSDIISKVSNLLTDQNSEMLLQALESMQYFLDIIQKNGDVDSILRELSGRTGCAVIMESDTFRMNTYLLPTGKTLLDYPNLFSENARIKKKLSADTGFVHRQRPVFLLSPEYAYSFAIAPMLFRSRPIGYVTIISGRDEVPALPKAIQRTILENAASTLSLIASFDINGRERRQAILERALNDLLGCCTGPDNRTAFWTESLSVDPKKPCRAVIFDCRGQGKTGSALLCEIRSIVAKRLPKAIVLEREGRCVAISQFGPGLSDFSADYASVTDEINAQFPELNAVAYIGGTAEDLFSVGKSFREADAARKFSRCIPETNCVCFYDEVELYNILSHVDDRRIISDFTEKYLSPLRQNEELHFDIVGTLEVYIKCGMSIRLTAEKLGTHENTVKYRIQKIRSILNNDLDDQMYLFNLLLAILASHME